MDRGVQALAAGSTAAGQATSARADGAHVRRPRAREVLAVNAIAALGAGQRVPAFGGIARPVALSRGPRHLPRPARHVLGIARHDPFRGRHHRFARRGHGPRGDVQHAQGKPQGTAVRHVDEFLHFAVRPCLVARARLPRPAIRPCAEPFLQRVGGLALQHDAAVVRRLARRRRGQRAGLRAGLARTNGRWPGTHAARTDRIRARAAQFQRTVRRIEYATGPSRRPAQPRDARVPRLRRDPGRTQERAEDDGRRAEWQRTPVGRPARRAAPALAHDRGRGRRQAWSGAMNSLARRRRALDIWPGFVDALSSLILVMVFVLLIFAIGQFVLSQTIAGKNRALADLNAQIAQLAKTLSLAQDSNTALNAKVKELSASLGTATGERDTLKTGLDAATAQAAKLNADIAALAALKAQLEQQVASLGAELDTSKKNLVAATDLNTHNAAQIELLNRQLAAVQEQLRQISAALEIANKNVKEKDLKIADLGKQLNIALASKVNQLEKYRSEFFGKLRAALGNRADIRVVGDRFVVPTDVLFDSGSADLNPAAQLQMAKLAQTLNAVAAEIPSNLDWIVRIDGHTDKRPIPTAQFASNWELSTARAVAIVKYLVVQGIPANRLSANGFGQFQPLDPADTPEAYAKNRRIEI